MSDLKPINTRVSDALRANDDAYTVAQAWFALTAFDDKLKGAVRKFAGKSDRIPGSQKELAEVLGVAQDTITAWKKRPDFESGVSQFMRRFLVGEFQANAKQMLTVTKVAAVSGDTGAMRLWWQLFERFAPGIFVEQDPEVLKAQAQEAIAKNPNDRLAELLKEAKRQSETPVEDADADIL